MLDKPQTRKTRAPASDRGAGRIARNRMRIAWMYYVEGLTQSEIADRLGIGRVTVVRNINEAIKQQLDTLDYATAFQASNDQAFKAAKMIADMAKNNDGELESFYYAFGEHDVYGIIDMPDEESMAAFAMRITSAGGVTARTVPLLTAGQVDRAAAMQVGYRPPGT